MEAAMSDILTGEQQQITSFSYLDKGIDDVEAGRVHTADEAFSIIETRLRNEI